MGGSWTTTQARNAGRKREIDDCYPKEEQLDRADREECSLSQSGIIISGDCVVVASECIMVFGAEEQDLDELWIAR